MVAVKALLVLAAVCAFFAAIPVLIAVMAVKLTERERVVRDDFDSQIERLVVPFGFIVGLMNLNVSFSAYTAGLAISMIVLWHLLRQKRKAAKAHNTPAPLHDLAPALQDFPIRRNQIDNRLYPHNAVLIALASLVLPVLIGFASYDGDTRRIHTLILSLSFVGLVFSVFGLLLFRAIRHTMTTARFKRNQDIP